MAVKYYIKTFGCQLNISDSERIAGFLEVHRIKPAKDISQANLIIFNTCGVRQSAEDRIYGQIHNLRKIYPKIKIILTGCLANRKDVFLRLENKVDLFFSINNFDKFENFIIKNYLKIKNLKLKTKPQYYKCKNHNYLSINPRYKNILKAFVPIMTGCNNFCSYCVVPYARGKEFSRPAQDIINEIKKLAKKGCKEITLLGQNVNSYIYKVKNRKSKLKIEIKNSKINFPQILDYLAKSFPKINFKFLTSHPKDFSDELIKVIAKNKNISREIHLPIQAGSDKILKAMNRPYTQKQYLNLIKKIKTEIPKASFTTDIIVGFPGETEKDFLESVKVFKKIGFSKAYINKYSPRPGTAAWKMKNSVSLNEKKRREMILRKITKK